MMQRQRLDAEAGREGEGDCEKIAHGMLIVACCMLPKSRGFYVPSTYNLQPLMRTVYPSA